MRTLSNMDLITVSGGIPAGCSGSAMLGSGLGGAFAGAIGGGLSGGPFGAVGGAVLGFGGGALGAAITCAFSAGGSGWSDNGVQCIKVE